jgi:hypothetical protein
MFGHWYNLRIVPVGRQSRQVLFRNAACLCRVASSSHKLINEPFIMHLMITLGGNLAGLPHHGSCNKTYARNLENNREMGYF